MWKVFPWGRSHVEGPPPLGEEPCVRSPPGGRSHVEGPPLGGGGPWGPTVPPLCPGLFGARMSPGTLRKMDLLRFSFFANLVERQEDGWRRSGVVPPGDRHGGGQEGMPLSLHPECPCYMATSCTPPPPRGPLDRCLYNYAQTMLSDQTNSFSHREHCVLLFF
ncbi:unnamed protein product [Arctogadus glacialis]